ncbi:MAG TPA: AI-2E family transporter [Actinocrinis sp.]|jgi:predicted PurR-regulated permease PerM
MSVERSAGTAEAQSGATRTDDAQSDTMRSIARQAQGREPGRPLRRTHPYYIGFVGGLGVIFAYYLAQALLSLIGILVLIVIALVLALGLNPFVERLTDRGMRRRWAVLIVAAAVLVLFGGFAAAIAQPLAQQTTALIASLPGHLQHLGHNRTIQQLDAKYNLIGRLEQSLTAAGTAKLVAGGVLGFGEFIISSVFKAFTVLVLTIYFVSSLPSIKLAAYQLVPGSRRLRIEALTEQVLTRIGGYVSGALIVASLAALATLLLLVGLRIPYMLPLVLLIGLTDLIPLIGATIGAVLVTVLVFFDSPTKAVVTGIFFILYQQFENYIVYPRVMHRTVDVPPMIGVIAALIGFSLLGVVGALLAIPLSAGLLHIAKEVALPAQDRS